MAHDHHETPILPVIPFNGAEMSAMEREDGKTAKVIASLTTGIFLLGLALYIAVLISVLARSPIYSIR